MLYMPRYYIDRKEARRQDSRKIKEKRRNEK